MWLSSLERRSGRLCDQKQHNSVGRPQVRRISMLSLPQDNGNEAPSHPRCQASGMPILRR
jgi:hypothetical protein